MAKGKKTTEQTIYNVMASYALTKNYSETSRLLNIPVTTVEKIVKDNKDKPEYVKLCNEKKEEFSNECSVIIELLLKATKMKADKLVSDGEHLDKTKLTDITTAVAVLYDKRALSQGESTENVTFTIPDGVKKYAE